MKCDKLTLYHSKSLNLPIYVASEVDAAIAELKDKCQMHDFFWEGCGFAKRGFKNTIAVSEAFDKLEAENAELKAKLEDVQASMYADVVDANMENRRLKRALWLARSERARSSALSYHLIESHPNKDVAATYKRKANKWEKVKDKCLAKAEEYK